MAVGFVVGCLRAIRASKSLTDLRKAPNSSLYPASLYNVSTLSNEDDFPPPPKRPLSPYMLFIQEKRQETYGSSSDVKAVDQVKALAEKWRKLSQVEKEIYSEKYKENLAVYTKTHEAYLKSLTEEQRQALNVHFRLRKENIHNRQMKATLRKLKKPVGPRNSFSYFVAAEASPLSNGKRITEMIKEISSQWKTLSEEEKEKYKKLAADDRIRYNSEMASWTKKMVDEGHSNLLQEMKKKTGKLKKDED